MIIAQERAFLKAQQQLREMEQLVNQAALEGRRIDLVERSLMAQLLEIGRTMLEAFVAAQGDGDAGPVLPAPTPSQPSPRKPAGRSGRAGDPTCPAQPPAGRVVRRLKTTHPRRYLSIFGELTIWRWVYAAREKQPIERCPLDERLGLPAGEFSYVLEDWLARLCVKESFSEAITSLHTLLGLAPSQRATERMSQQMAQPAEAFRWQQAAPPAEEEGELLVATSDAKGVPMRRPLEERLRPSPRRGKGEKAQQKQLAYVGAVYTIDRFRRTADDVVDELARKQRAADRPQPQHKQVWAEMTRDKQGDSCTGRERLFIELAVAAHERDPTHEKPLVCVMDGEAALWTMQREWLPRAVGILDLFHVLERLWEVAHVFHREGSREAAEFVGHYLRMLLEGKVGYVIGSFKRLRNAHPLSGTRRRVVSAAITYYENNRQHMRYDEYLAAGYPIGSGVAEGACRHVVKDRLEQTGMRWTVPGAQAILHLRAIYLNDQWDDFVKYRIETEQARLYTQTAA
jgi:hypothetical protein